MGAILEIIGKTNSEETTEFIKELATMYEKWANKNGLNIQILNIIKLKHPKEVEIIYEITMEIEGEEKFDYLKQEEGIHTRTKFSKRTKTVQNAEVLIKVSNASNKKIEEVYYEEILNKDATGKNVKIKATHLPTGKQAKCFDVTNNCEKAKENAKKLLGIKLEQENKEYKYKRFYNYEPKIEVIDLQNDIITEKIEEIINGNLEIVLK